MKIAKKTKVTLMLDTDVHEGLRQKVGKRKLGAYLSQLARPHVITDHLEDAYKAQAADVLNSEDMANFVDDEILAPNVWRL
jgi:hypothetical protein